MLSRSLVFPALAFATTSLLLAASSAAQSADQPYARRNSFGIIAAYSNDSSHILMGLAENRRLLDFGVSYSRRIMANRKINWQYDGEFFPVALDSDPVQTTVSTVTFANPPLTETSTASTATLKACTPASGSGSFPGTGTTYTFVSTCGRRWVVGEAFSPVGMQWNFLTEHRLQPFFVGHGGYMFSTQTIPISGAGSFNFTFDVGAGIEFYRTRVQSFRVSYRYHHISNKETALENPGIDNGILQLSWTFGR